MFYKISFIQEIQKESQQKATTANMKMGYLRRLDGLEERMSTLLSVDHPSAQKCILEARDFVEVSACFLHVLNNCEECYVTISWTWGLVSSLDVLSRIIEIISLTKPFHLICL